MENGLEYLNSLGLHKVKPGLERIHNLLRLLDNPELKVPGILIAGTNGKGSVAAAISAVLGDQGYRVGLYTSPHLISITERISINGSEILESELCQILDEIKEIADNEKITPSYFEVITTAAFVYLARKDVDINVLEVGMGGRWDATNVITPLVSVITNISLDHSEYLGESVELIAAEKACIIKPNVPVVTAASQNALEVISCEATNRMAPLFIYSKDFQITGEDTGQFSYKGSGWDLQDMSSNLTGSYQLENLAVAISTLEQLDKLSSFKIDQNSLRDGLNKINWPGRFEIVRAAVPFILDGAHNPGAAKSLAASLKKTYPDTKFTFLIGMLSDKGHDQFFKEISLVADKIILTNVLSDRGSNPADLLNSATKYIEQIEIFEDYKNAYHRLWEENVPSCVTGSIYLIGAIKNLSNQN
ncbi:MAG: folylpolyglutamate synthase/dihydrofolate synthase family protein [Thermodesulfobacteriota bacterium]